MKKMLLTMVGIGLFTGLLAQVDLPFHKYSNWDILPDGITRNDTVTYNSGAAKLASTGDYIKVHFNQQAEALSFYMKQVNTWGGNDNHVFVYESSLDRGNDGGAWGEPIADFDRIFFQGAANTGAISVSDSSRWLFIQYLKQSNNVGIDSLVISAHKYMQLSVSVDVTDVQPGEEVVFSSQVTGEAPPYTYSWDFDGDGVEDASQQNANWQYTAVGLYSVSLTVTDANENVETLIKPNLIKVSNKKLMISEVTHPADKASAKFVELYNAGDDTIHLDENNWYLILDTYSKGQIKIALLGRVAPKQTYVVANKSNKAFEEAFNLVPGQSNGNLYGNGNDPYSLYYNFSTTTNSGELIDVYGVPGENGANTDWDYEDSKANRLSNVMAPRTSWDLNEWVIVKDCPVRLMTPGMHPAVAWKGDVDNNWLNQNNWDANVPPTGVSVRIPAGCSFYPTLNGPITINRLQLDWQASIIGISYLTVSDVARVYSYIEPYDPLTNAGWHFLASCVAPFEISSSGYAPGPSDDLYFWDEPQRTWLNYKNPTTGITHVEAGQGVLMSVNTDSVRYIEGDLFAESQIAYSNLSYNPAWAYAWHLLGNPYSADMIWQSSPDWNIHNINGVAKIMRYQNGGYNDVHEGDLIPCGSGFMVCAVDPENSITLPASSIVHGNQVGILKDPVKYLSLVLDGPDGLAFQAWLGVDSLANSEFDIKLDSPYLSGAVLGDFYSQTPEGMALSTDVRAFAELISFPLYLDVIQPVSLSLKVEGLSAFPATVEFQLKDHKTNQVIDIEKDLPYQFAADTLDEAHRFTLSVVGATDIAEPALLPVRMWYDQSMVFIDKLPEGEHVQLEIFNMQGQCVWQKAFVGQGHHQYRVDLPAGIYLGRLTGSHTRLSTKLRACTPQSQGLR